MSTHRASQRGEDASKYVLHSQHIPQQPTSSASSVEGARNLPELFRTQARRRGAATLFSFQDQSRATLTRLSYAEGLETSTRLAQALHTSYRDVPDAESPVVGIWFERSIELHLAILATTISGAAWLPFDFDAPAARVEVCLRDSRACILLCDAAHHAAALHAASDVPGCSVITFDELDAQSQHEMSPVQAVPGPQPHHIAYMIYTSGSTGTPKGIAIPHSAALTFALSERSVLDTGPDDVVWQGFSPAFDMFIEEVWVSIAGGAHLAIGSRAEYQDVTRLGGVDGVWAQRGVTLVNAVPTLISIMASLNDDCSLPRNLRLLNVGGEACPPSLVKRLWHPDVRIINTYGPSETTVTATFQELFPDRPVTIGKPLPGYHVLLLPVFDTNPGVWSPLPIREGTEGELAIGGPCLARGYIGREELTADKFIQHPLSKDSRQRLYRTGDRVRLDSDLNIVFLGRIDTQVKHRGFRIELGEIESALAAHPTVQTTCVILSAATDRLEAYVVASDNAVIDTRDLRAAVGRLPSYMQPEAYYFITAEELPRLPSGKINAKALQEVSVGHGLREKNRGGERDAIRTPHSEDGSDMGLLLRILGEVFPQAIEITPHSDFFEDLGGHSLVAAMLVSRLRADGPEGSVVRRLGLQDIYLHRTPEGMITALLGDSDSSSSIDEKRRDSWPVSRARYLLCGLAQIPALLLFFFLAAVATLGPYLVFYAVLQIGSIGHAVAAAYITFVGLPIINTVIGVAGKWLTLGAARAGEYPVYGTYYYRWWLAERFTSLVDMTTVAETPLMPVLMRGLGARVGSHCHIGQTLIGAAFDLVTIGDDVVLNKDAALMTSWVEHGRLILAPVRVDSGTSVGSQSVLEGGSIIQEGGEVGPMTMVPSGTMIPAGERWIGSPARFHSRPQDVGHMRRDRPGWMRVALTAIATSFTSVFIFPIIYFIPQIPSIILIDEVRIPGIWLWSQTAAVAVPAALIYLALVFLELLLLRWLILGRVRECSYRTTSFYNFRRWFVGRLMELSLIILHPVYATLYVVPFLRLLGVRIGRMAEVSTARGIDFELTEIGDESFIADGAFIGDREIRSNMVTLKKTRLSARAFAGNSSLVPQGTELPSNSLVGVLSLAPEKPLKEGQSVFGSPPVLMPARQCAQTTHADRLLYSPTWTLVIIRLFIEGMRIVLPRVLIVFGLGFGTQVFVRFYEQVGVVASVALLPLFYLFLFALPALLFTALCKWVLIGRYQRAEWPLWSINVWKSEFVTSTYETIASPLLTQMLLGTPFLAWAFWLLGVQVGSRTTLLSVDITEYDMVSIGDEAVINRHSHPQTHLFEDRVMKIGRVDIGEGACMKTYAHALPNSSIGAQSQLGSLSLVMKGETVPSGETWEGDPIAPARRMS